MTSDSPLAFTAIRFGKASAEAESATVPDLLLDGYLDSEGLTGKALRGHEFLFLGYKGSGKTALAEHLKLRAQSDANLFVHHVFLSAFPYRSFQKIVSGSAEPETRLPTAWSWLLLVLILDSFLSDEGLTVDDRRSFDRAAEALSKKGLLPARTLHDLVVTSSKRSFKVKLPLDFGLEYDSANLAGEDAAFLHLVHGLKKMIGSARSESRHVVIVDGLDDILSEREIQYQALTALVTEAMRLNTDFTASGTPAKIVIMCRTDLYEKLPGPNKNKVRQDFAIEFDWYHDPRRPSDSKLVTLANLRTRLTLPSVSDVFQQFFQERVESRQVVEFLLLHTRHTPRDFLQLLVHVQRYWVRDKFTREQILSAIRDYSISYFLPEIKDELVGYITTEDADAVLKLIASLGKREFALADLEEARKGRSGYASLDLAKPPASNRQERTSPPSRPGRGVEMVPLDGDTITPCLPSRSCFGIT